MFRSCWKLLLLLLAIASPATAAPDEEALGKSQGYPIGTPRNWFYDERVRVGSFSHVDRILPHNVLKRAASPLPLLPPPPGEQLTSRLGRATLVIRQFLAGQRITGLLIIKDGQILVEHYQYDRTAAHRLVSHSMAKSIVSLGVGIAVHEGKIRSLDDTVATYVRDLAGSAYGETSIRNLLRMASGVRFTEVYDGQDDLATFSRLRSKDGTTAALRAFNSREAAAGNRFKYATSETVVLAALLRAVTHTTLSDYLTSRLWQPMGAEADATWIKTLDGLEVGGGSFNAVLRDYGRLGMLLANDGAVGARQVIPKDYLLEATDWRRQPAAFAPRTATPYFGYGYQFWLYPGDKRRFALLGVYGQSIFVDPELKLVMVITAVAKNASVGKETLAVERDLLWRELVNGFGRW
ncbi:MAG: serine hydrolase domain-containing protein [Hyphomicrobiaceae bacterium]